MVISTVCYLFFNSNDVLVVTPVPEKRNIYNTLLFLNTPNHIMYFNIINNIIRLRFLAVMVFILSIKESLLRQICESIYVLD